MGMTLTEGEKQWRRVAKGAMERDEAWESCEDCLRHHPVGFDGECGDPSTSLPGQPSEFVG